MKILVINADCLEVNTSANLCHLAYLKGLVDSGHDVTLLSADGRDYVSDESMQIPKEVKSYTYYGISLYEKISLLNKQRQTSAEKPIVLTARNNKVTKSLPHIVVDRIKKIILNFYGIHGIYTTFVKKAERFSSCELFDYVLSISTPVASHLLAYNLLKKGHIKGNHWIQIWEDPWYSDAYGTRDNYKIFEEEQRLLSLAEKVCYVSPLTLQNQQKLFPESAEKMYWQPLPYYYKRDIVNTEKVDHNVYGYFGDYAPAVRDLEPFYQAAVRAEIETNICGNPDNLYLSTEHVHIYPRLSLDKLRPIEDRTNILVFLCNRKGGQIPGKIYQYSGTNKVILFILDGTQEEQEIIKSYFEPFNRYLFCKNTVEDITCAIKRIENGDFGKVNSEPIEEFNPPKIIRKILNDE